MAWQTLETEDGRKYYYNDQTGVTTWDKPEELLEPLDRALLATGWTKYTTPEGRDYFHNADTNETTWDVPAIVQRQLVESKIWPEMVQQLKGDPEELFLAMLQQHDVGKATFAQAMPKLIHCAEYWAVTNVLDRQALFEQFQASLKQKKAQLELETQQELARKVAQFLQESHNVHHYTRWKTVKEAVVKEFPGQTEKQLREAAKAHIAELKSQHESEQREARAKALQEFEHLLESDLDAGLESSWQTVYHACQEHPRVQELKRRRVVHDVDILDAFIRHVKGLERRANDERQRLKRGRALAESRRRIAFERVLRDLQAKGHITAVTKWKELVPLLEDMPEFRDLALNQTGSTALELFWDIVYEEERKLRTARERLLDELASNTYELDLETSFEDFCVAIKTRSLEASESVLRSVYDRLKDAAAKRVEHDRLQDQRRLRRAQEELKKTLHDLNPNGHSWESVQSQLDFDGLTQDQGRQVFDRYIREREIEERREAERLKRAGLHY